MANTLIRLALLGAPGPEQAMNPADIFQIFNFNAVWTSLDQFEHQLGTATSGPLGAMVLAFFIVSLTWAWLKNRFDTWSFWELFLRLFIVVIGLASWHSAFAAVDQALYWLANGGGIFDSYNDLYTLAGAPFQSLTFFGIPVGGFGWIAALAVNPFLALLVGAIGILDILVIAAYAISIIIQQIMVIFLYAIGPLFLVCYAFEPLSDLWMRWVRAYLSIRVWTLMIHFFLFALATAINTTTITNTFTSPNGFLLAIVYLLILLFAITSAYPLSRALIGSQIQPIASASLVPSVASAAATGALVVAGMAVGSAGGPAGASAGGATGGGAGKVASSAAPTREG